MAEEAKLTPHELVARRMREFRDLSGATQRELADEMTAAGFDWSLSTVKDVERGRRHVALAELLGLAGVFRIGAVAFLTPQPDELLSLGNRAVLRTDEVLELLVPETGVIHPGAASRVTGLDASIGRRHLDAIARERAEEVAQEEARTALVQATVRDLPRMERVLAAHPDELPELALADRAGLYFELNHKARLVVRRRVDDSIYGDRRRGPLYVLDPDDEGVLRFTVEDGEQRIELLTESGERHPVVDAERVEAASR